MRLRILAFAILLVASAVLRGQERIEPRQLVVRRDGPTLTAWQPGRTLGEATKVWEALPLSLDLGTRKEWGRQTLPVMSQAVIADYDDDGVNELLVADELGLTVYGRSPAYYPFPLAVVGAIGGETGLLVADVDGDRRSELVTQRTLNPSPDWSGRRGAF
jgi:hypothetical protein